MVGIRFALLAVVLAAAPATSGRSTASPWLVYQTTAALPASYGCPDVPRQLDYLHTWPGRTLPSAESTANDPQWSPDGRRIAFSSGAAVCTSGDGIGQDAAAIWVIDAGGGHLRRVTPTNPKSAGFLDRSPSWSPDGRRIAFARFDIYRDTGGIYTVGSDGDGLTRISSRTALSLDWSPNGRSIAFIPGKRGTFGYSASSSVELLDLRSGGSRRFSVRDPYDLAWSPNGRALAVTNGNHAISILSPSGVVTRRISVPMPNRAWLNGVTWSPDGARLAYSDGRAVYTLHLAGGTRTRLFAGLAPDWRR